MRSALLFFYNDQRSSAFISANASRTETAVQATAQTVQAEIVNYLVDHGAEYHICTAALQASLDCLKDFLKADAGLVNARSAHGLPLLYFPVIHARLAAAETLIRHAADLNTASPDGITPLHGAVMFNQPKMAEWLIEHSAEPNPIYAGKGCKE